MENKKPVLEHRIRGVKAVVWGNSGQSGVFYTVDFKRLYMDENEWKTTRSFGERDLELVAQVAAEVEALIAGLKLEEGEEVAA